MEKRVRVQVAGRVQGVFYRASTKAKAEELGVVGTVEGQPDGSVEIIAQGPTEKVNELIEWAKKGPPKARVDGIQVEEEAPTGEFAEFRVLR